VGTDKSRLKSPIPTQKTSKDNMGAEDCHKKAMNKAQLIIVGGPSGVGKGTLTSMLFEEHPDQFGFSVSHTTRAPRVGEVDGKHYHFTNLQDFQKMVDNKEMLEYAHVHTNMYGTSRKAVENVLNSGKSCILDIDVQGAESIYKIKDELGFHVAFVFFLAPSDEALEARLRGRGTESEDKIQIRLKNAITECQRARDGDCFNTFITNADKQTAYEEFRNLVLKKRAESLEPLCGAGGTDVEG
jgi:guanylate kinase